MSDAVEIRDTVEADLETVLRLNDAAVPNVNRVDLDAMRWFLDNAAYFRSLVSDGGLSGYLIGLGPDAAYDSPNFQWFKERYSAFVYVDRIVIDEGRRWSGLGSRLYEDIMEFSRPLAPVLTCEVNLRPRNAASLAFHEKHGFTQAGTQDTEGGSKTVALLTREL